MAAAQVYKIPSLSSVESRTLDKAKFAECLHSVNLSLPSAYLLSSVFVIALVK